jgi:hypothetical protein
LNWRGSRRDSRHEHLSHDPVTKDFELVRIYCAKQWRKDSRFSQGNLLAVVEMVSRTDSAMTRKELFGAFPRPWRLDYLDDEERPDVVDANGYMVAFIAADPMAKQNALVQLLVDLVNGAEE